MDHAFVRIVPGADFFRKLHARFHGFAWKQSPCHLPVQAWTGFAAAGILSAGLEEGRAHAVEQLYATLEQERGRWSVEVLFDAAYALPEFRANTDEPAPERSWLVDRSPREHERIREGAEAWLREKVRFFHAGKLLTWEAGFPDFEVVPPSFPKLLNGGAYIRVRMAGELGKRSGEVAMELAGGAGPKVVVAIGGDGEPRYITVEPDARAALFEAKGAGLGAQAVWAAGALTIAAGIAAAQFIRTRK